MIFLLALRLSNRIYEINRYTPNMSLLILYFPVQIYFFGTVFRYFSQCNFKSFRRQSTSGQHFQLNPNHKKAFYGPTKIELFQIYFSKRLWKFASVSARNFDSWISSKIFFVEFLNFSWKYANGLNLDINPLSANHTNWLNTLKQFVSTSRVQRFKDLKKSSRDFVF